MTLWVADGDKKFIDLRLKPNKPTRHVQGNDQPDMWGAYRPVLLRGCFVGEWLFGTPYDYRVVAITWEHDHTVTATLWGRDRLITVNHPRNAIVLGERPANTIRPRGVMWSSFEPLTQDERFANFVDVVLIPMYEALVKTRKVTPWGHLKTAVINANRKQDFPRLFGTSGARSPNRYDFILSGQEMEYLLHNGRLHILRRELLTDVGVHRSGKPYRFPGLVDVPIAKKVLRWVKKASIPSKNHTFKTARTIFDGDPLGFLELVYHEFIPN